MFEKNKSIIQEKYPNIIAIIENGNKMYKNCDEVKIDKARNSQPIIKIEKNEKEYLLNSIYSPEDAASKWAKHYGQKEFEAVFFVFGLANGMYVERLLNEINECAHILVYEPDARIYYKVMNEMDMQELLSDKRIMIAGGQEQLPIVVEWLNQNISYMNYKKVNICPVPNYMDLYMEEFAQVMQLISHQLMVVDSSVYSELKFQDELSENVLHNIKDSIFQSTINQLKRSLEDCDKENIPVIIVSAGPSLDKNINELKKAEGKAFLMVVDTALKAVEKAGIIPDLSVTVDPHKPLSLFEGEGAKKVPFLYCKYSNWKLNNLLEGRRFYCGHGSDFIGAIHMSMKGENIDDIDSGGSVAHELFSLAIYLGFQKIILVGQDLAYPNGRGHASAAYDGKDDPLKNKKNLIWVEDIDGNQVLTEGNMDLYRRWFEKQIVRYKGKIKVFDATEGGAKIKGTIIEKLSTVIEQECKISYDFKEKIATIPPSYNEEEKKHILEYFSKVPEILKKLKKEIEKGIEDYKKLSELYGQHKEQTREFLELVERVNERNQWIEEQGELELVSMYNREEEYKIQEEVYNTKENEEDEMQDIVEKGIYMLQSYIKGIDKLVVKWDECMNHQETEQT